MHFDLIIIGAGPTGIACAIEAYKANLKYLVLEKGYLVNSLYHFPTNMRFFSTSVNLEIGDIPFISHHDKPTRIEALEYYRRIAEAYKLKIRFDCECLGLSPNDKGYDIHTSQGDFRALSVVIATGFYDQYRSMDVPGEALSKVKHYYDDAHIYMGRKVAVVGGANSACDVALETWQKGAEVTMIVRQKALYEKVKYWILPNIKNRIAEGSIKAFFESNIIEIQEKRILIESDEKRFWMENDYVLAMTGYQPNYSFLKKVGIEFKDEDNIPKFNPESLESNVQDVYLTGVILSGDKTSSLFIENTRHHGNLIIKNVLKRKAQNKI